MNVKALTLALLSILCIRADAELRRFQNAEQTKSFYAELTGYDAKTKRVTVKLKNGRAQSFSIDILSEDDKKYILENGKRLAVGNDIRVSMKDFNDKYKKVHKPRTEDRVYPSGYTITLSNRAKQIFENITLNYTLYYAVQGYVKPGRKQESKSGTLVCKHIPAQGNATVKTETVDIISGKLDPVVGTRQRTDAEGNRYDETYVVEEGGRRKDLLLGCKVDIVVDGEVVKSVTEGTIGIEDANERR